MDSKRLKIVPMDTIHSFAKSSLKENDLKISRIIEESPIAKPVNLLSHFLYILKAANVFIFRSRFRTMKFLKKDQVDFIHDVAYFPEKKQKNWFLKRFTEKNVNLIF